MIPQSFIQDLLARVDVVDVVGKVVALKKAGANFLGLCPFHGEKTPSFTVSPAKQFYHCFGCGAHGTAVGFLMEHAGLTYVEAIGDLAQSVGLAVPHEASAHDAPPKDPGLLETLEVAAGFYRQRLKDAPRAVDYLKGRGVAGETAARFAIGYAPEGWRGLQAAVADYASPTMVGAGLVIEGEADDGPKKRYDRFRDRIMFPIRNPRGQIIGFGGRVLDQGEPKYMNSPETAVFSKGRELYGLFEARDALREHNCAIVVEGYMDVVMLAQHGVGNAVATLGTSTTPDHVRKLLRQVDRVVFSFDGDAAGRKAAWRALEACLPHAADTKRLDFLFLPPEHDPDSYVREHGEAGFRALLERALPLSEFMIQELSMRADLDQSEGRARFLSLARPLLQALPDAALKMQLLHRVADVGAVGAVELGRFVAARGGANARGAPGAPGPREPSRDGRSNNGWAGGQHRSDGAGDGREGGWNGGRPGDRGADRGADWGGRSAPGRGRGGGFRRGAPGGIQSDFPEGLRPRAAPPELLHRARLLSALHPLLAHDPCAREFLPQELLDWIEMLRSQPAGCSLAGVCESLRASQPELAAALERDVARGHGLLAELTLEEARAEFEGALAQLRDRSVREEIDALIASGLPTDAQRARYQLLVAIRGKRDII